MLFVAAADRSEGLPSNIRRIFTHEISMGPLTEEQRTQMLSQSLQPVAQLFPNVSHFYVSHLPPYFCNAMFTTCISTDLYGGEKRKDSNAHCPYILVSYSNALCLLQTSSEDLMKGIAGQTSGFLARDIQALISDACATLVSGHLFQPDIFQDSLNSCVANGTAIDRPQSLRKEDFLKALEQALERTKKRIGSALGTPKVI